MSITLPIEEAEACIYQYASAPLTLVESKISGTSRWTIFHEAILKDESTGKYYLAEYEKGAIERQECETFGWEAHDKGTVTFPEVKPIEVVATEWVFVNAKS